MTHEAKCFKDYQDLGKCYSYFNSIFNDIRFDFYHYKGEFKSKIDNIEDPILRHIALYLVENYCSSKKYFSTDGTWKNNDACDSLNIWLDYKKNYFTHARLCKGNVQLWNKTIEPIWEELEKKAQEENNGSPKKWCARNNHFRGHLELPEKLKSPRCYKHIPNEYECFLPFPPNMCNLKNSCTNEKLKKFYEKCKQNNNGKDFTDFSYLFSKVIDHGVSPLKRISDATFSRQVDTNCECPSMEYATPISVCLSFFGTLLVLFLLSKFTPLGSKLSYRGINKKRLRDNFNEKLEYEEYARSMKKNSHPERKRNNIYYESTKN